MTRIDWDQQLFKKSTRSGGGTDSNCLEIATCAGRVGIRDTKDPVRAVTLDVPAGVWTTFVTAAKSGEFAH
ncbi:DUF397 domain-containing protein [Cryptosporangium sp. NPDC048952]|uniref:DUF397 domain-containing protein n=1 Tax=Cryptosporangium sp. NPDC048952 TaxID=3363961 RepID=UPI003713F967